MANVVLLSTLRTKVQELSDEVNATDRTATAMIDRFLNEGGERFHDLIVGKFGTDYAYKDIELATVANVETVALPQDFLKELNLAFKDTANRYHPLDSFEWDEVDDFVHNVDWSPSNLPRYKIAGAGGNIHLVPRCNAVETVKLRYAPKFKQLVNADDSIDDFNGWSKLMVLYAVREIAIRNEDSTFRELTTRLAEEEDRIQRIAANRVGGKPERSVDLKGKHPRRVRRGGAARWRW